MNTSRGAPNLLGLLGEPYVPDTLEGLGDVAQKLRGEPAVVATMVGSSQRSPHTVADMAAKRVAEEVPQPKPLPPTFWRRCLSSTPMRANGARKSIWHSVIFCPKEANTASTSFFDQVFPRNS